MKKILISIVTMALLIALAIPMAVPVAGASTATFGDGLSDWEKTSNRIVDDTADGVGDAPAWDDVAWGGWVSPAWDGPSTGIPPYSYSIPYWSENDTWVLWGNDGVDWEQHTDQWFRTTVDIPACWVVTAVELVYKYNEAIIPVNDDLYVYVDDDYVAAGGTAGVGWVQAFIGTAPPDPTYGSNTFVAAVLEAEPWSIAPETGWYLDGGLNLPPELFTPGSHDIHVLGEEFDINGGLGHLVVKVTYDEASFVSLTPLTSYNPLGTDHTVTATITPAVAGIPITFEVTGANSVSGVVSTNGSGVAQFTYTGTVPGVDTITAYIDCDGDTYWTEGEPTIDASKEWFCNFVTGGGNITEEVQKGNRTMEKVIWTFGGNVGFLPDGTIHGQFQIRDHDGKESWHGHNAFDSLVFSGGPTESPPASVDTAVFTGTFTSNKGNTKYLRITIWDDQEPGRDFDWITVEQSDDSGATWDDWFEGEPISGGNLQVHEGCKS